MDLSWILRNLPRYFDKCLFHYHSHARYTSNIDVSLIFVQLILDAMRVIKSPSEISLLRQSCKIASEAFQQTIKYCAEKCSQDEVLSEHQIWAKIDYECRIHGNYYY